MHVTPILDTSRMLPYSLSKNSCMHHTTLMPKRTAVPCATMLCHLELAGPACERTRHRAREADDTGPDPAMQAAEVRDTVTDSRYGWRLCRKTS